MRAYLRNIYTAVSTILIGMGVTIKEMFQPPVTNQYPYQYRFERKKNVRPIHDGFRGQLFNRIEDCIGCKKCAIVCPVSCIYIDTSRLPKGVTLPQTRSVVCLKNRKMFVGELEEGDDHLEPGTIVKLRDMDGQLHEFPSETIDHVMTPKKRSLLLDRFDIDMSLCMYCGLCTEACPTDCLYMTKTFEYSTYDRSSLIFHFAKPSIYEPFLPKDEAQEGEEADAS